MALSSWQAASAQTPAPRFALIIGNGGYQGANPVARWKRIVALFAWALLVAAAARPQWIGDAVDLPRSGRDLLVAVDASGSMDTPDTLDYGFLRSVTQVLLACLVAPCAATGP